MCITPNLAGASNLWLACHTPLHLITIVATAAVMKLSFFFHLYLENMGLCLYIYYSLPNHHWEQVGNQMPEKCRTEDLRGGAFSIHPLKLINISHTMSKFVLSEATLPDMSNTAILGIIACWSELSMKQNNEQWCCRSGWSLECH